MSFEAKVFITVIGVIISWLMAIKSLDVFKWYIDKQTSDKK